MWPGCAVVMSEKRRTRPPKPLARPDMAFEENIEGAADGLMGVAAPEDGEYSPWREVRSLKGMLVFSAGYSG